MVSELFILDEEAKDEVQVIGADDLSTLKGRNVIVVEDIVDTGNTMRKLMNVLSKHEPASVKGLNLNWSQTEYQLKLTLIFSGIDVIKTDSSQ